MKEKYDKLTELLKERECKLEIIKCLKSDFNLVDNIKFEFGDSADSLPDRYYLTIEEKNHIVTEFRNFLQKKIEEIENDVDNFIHNKEAEYES